MGKNTKRKGKKNIQVVMDKIVTPKNVKKIKNFSEVWFRFLVPVRRINLYLSTVGRNFRYQEQQQCALRKVKGGRHGPSDRMHCTMCFFHLV